MKIILASGSPRRKELLELMGLDFEIIPAKGEEKITRFKPEEVVMELAMQKATEVAWKHRDEECLVIGADTVVVKDSEILGKPADEEDAVNMLRRLQGDTHQVYTGVCLIKIHDRKQHIREFFEATNVTFYPMTDQEIRAYVASGEPMDKAGAYGIQGKAGMFVERIYGDYNNVVGLPVGRLYHEMKHI